MSKLIAKGITKTYNGKHVLHGVDLELESGKTYGMIGGTARGKTTLLSIPDGAESGVRGQCDP